MCSDHKVVLITGATKNTGFAAAKKFAKEGFDVCITSRILSEANMAAAKLMELYPSIKAYGVQMDVSKTEDIKKGFRELWKWSKRLDVFVSNAAHLGIDLCIFNTKPEDYDAVMDSNAKGTFFCCQEAVKLMMEQKHGSMVLMSSVQALGAVPGRIIYTASKAAISGMTRGMAYELGKYGIRCNALVAGAIWSDRWERLSEDEMAARRSKWPLEKESSMENIADAIYFLASDQAATITGTELVVDSGINACMVPYDHNWDKKYMEDEINE